MRFTICLLIICGETEKAKRLIIMQNTVFGGFAQTGFVCFAERYIL